MNFSSKMIIRKTVAYFPKPVRKTVTKRIVRKKLRCLLDQTDVIDAELNPEKKDALVAGQKARFPSLYKKVNAEIKNLLSTGALDRFPGKRQIIKDMRFCYFAYGAMPGEYMEYSFGDLNTTYETRHEYITELVRVGFRFSINDFTKYDYATKEGAYSKLKDYYKRDVCFIHGRNDEESFRAFVRKHPVFAKKELVLSQGKGFEIIDAADYNSTEELFEYLVSGNTVMLEEKIEQNSLISAFNPSSVNTVRLFTFYTRSGVIAPFAFFRAGREGTNIDGMAGGGVNAAVDTRTGTITVDASDKYGNPWPGHPDTGTVFKGFIFPNWDQAVEMCKEAALLTPDIKYLGWDLAYTENNEWLIVEVNTSGQFVQQMSMKKGCRSALKEIVEDVEMLVPYEL